MEKFLRHPRPQGFTLVELLVYIAVSTIALLVFVTFMVDVSRSAARARIVQEVHQNAQFVLDRLGQEVRGSQSILVGSSIFDTHTGTLALTTSTGTHTFTLTSGMVTLDLGSGPTPLTTDSVQVTQLRFTNTNPSVTLDLQVEENSTSPAPQTINLQTTLVPHQTTYQ